MVQSKRMFDEALKLKSEDNNVIADFICPTLEARKLFPADYVIWVMPFKKLDLRTQTKCSLSLKNMTFTLLLKMPKFGLLKCMKI